MTGACSLLADIIYIFAFNQKPIFTKEQSEPHQEVLSRRERGSIGPIYVKIRKKIDVIFLFFFSNSRSVLALQRTCICLVPCY